jgi:hypothetical protein
MAASVRARQERAFPTAFKGDVSALEAEWVAWVTKTYPDK